MKNKRSLQIVLGVAVVLLIVWWLLPDRADERAGTPGWGGRDAAARSTVAVEVGEISHRTMLDVGEYTGTLQAGSQFVLAPKAGGRIRSLQVDIGDPVRQGQVIARLDDEEFTQAVAEARASMEVAQAQLEDARARREVRRREFERMQDLREQGLASEAEFDVARSEFDAADANVRVAEAQHAQRHVLGVAEYESFKRRV
jgi:multidrug efflux pump subunit AcrA (membrane-fusion protein)